MAILNQLLGARLVVALALLGLLAACAPGEPIVRPTPAPVTFDAPLAQIEEGLHLTSVDDEWDGYGEAIDVRGDVAVVGASEWNYYGDGYAYVYRRVQGTWQQEAQLAASDRNPIPPTEARGLKGQRFGSSVALGDGVLAVGAPGTDATVGGAVYVFEHDGQSWVETAKMTSDAGDDDDAGTDAAWLTFFGRMPRRSFGALVALHGDTLAVGGDERTRSVTIFERDDSDWEQQATIGIPGQPERDLYMVDMDLAGDTLALSVFYVAPEQPQSEMNVLLAGKATVFLFERDGARWQERQRFEPVQSDLLFPREVNIGASVALQVDQSRGDGERATRLAVGLQGFPDLSGVDLSAAAFFTGYPGPATPLPPFAASPTEVGMVTVFEREHDGGWRQQATLTPATGGEAPGAGFGFMENAEDIFDPENVATMVFPGHLYSQAPEVTFFGATVDLDGERLAVTSGYANQTHVFEWREGKWVYTTLLRLNDGQMWEDYAQVVAISGDTLLLGTPGEFGNSARLFSLGN